MKNKELQTHTMADKAVCLALTFRRLGESRKADVLDLTEGASREGQPNPAMLSLTKKLFSSAEYNAIKTHDGYTASYMRTRALPSMFKAGIWLIPTTLVGEIDKRLTAREKDRNQLVDTLVAAWPALIDRAQGELGRLFSAGEYVTQDEVKASFALSWRYITLKPPSSLEGVSAEIFAKEKAKAEKQWSDATAEIRNMLRLQMKEMVADMMDKLTPDENTGKKKAFRGTMADKLKDFLNNFEARNITGDGELAALTAKAKKLLQGVDGKSLSSDEDLRNEVSKGFSAIKVKMSEMVIEAPSRAIVFSGDV